MLRSVSELVILTISFNFGDIELGFKIFCMKMTSEAIRLLWQYMRAFVLHLLLITLCICAAIWITQR